jgi:glycosyltransferase involved in cell wall biosynthesis
MSNKNVAFYLGDFKRSGGTERACIAVANALIRSKNHNVFLITTNKETEESFFVIDPKIKLIYLDIKSGKREYFSLSKRLKSSLKENKIDFLVAVEVISLIFLLPVFLSKILGRANIKLLVWEHFNFTVSLNKKIRVYLRKFAARYADAIIVLTQKDAELWRANLKVKAKIISINNPSPFVISRKEYNIESTNIIAVGRLKYQKGFDRLLNIWSEFKKLNPHASWKLQIIGSGPDRDKLKDQATQLGIDLSVEWIENTPHVKSYYENAAFLVMTSRFEGLPMTLIEAQSFGLPIIAYDCLTGPAEVITQSSGFLIEDDNICQFVEQLNILIKNRNLRESMSFAAKKEADRFSEISIVSKWDKLIKGEGE